MEQNSAIMKEVSRWADTTGIHGPVRIKQSESVVRKMFWICLVTAGTLMSAYQIFQLANKYYSYPYKITRSTIYEYPMMAPAISICNVSPARLMEFRELNKKNTTSIDTLNTNSPVNTDIPIHTESPDNETCEPNCYGEDERAADTNAILSETSPFNSSTFNFTGEQSLDNLSSSDQVPNEIGIKYTFLDVYGALTLTEKENIGTKLDQFLIDCIFNQSFCNKRDFYKWLHPNYGSCFTFNANDWNEAGNKIGLTMKAGLLYSFSAVFFIDQVNYISQISPNSGLKIAIHEASIMPQFDKNVINALPGFETTVLFTKAINGLLPDPYEDNCYDYSQTENIKINNYANHSKYSIPNVKYSRDACYVTCLQKSIEKKCKCSSLLLPPSMKNDENSTFLFPICKYKYNVTVREFTGEKKCIDAVTEAEYLNCLNFCRPECNKTDYVWKISTLEWPSMVYEESFKKMVMERNQYVQPSLIKSYIDDSSENKFFTKNFVKLIVSLESNEVTSVKSEATYSVFDLLSELGGQCGLWLGFSFLTFVELMEIIFDVIIHSIKKPTTKVFVFVKPSTSTIKM